MGNYATFRPPKGAFRQGAEGGTSGKLHTPYDEI